MIDGPAPGWTPVWTMPNVILDDPVETSHAALVPVHDDRLRPIADRNQTLRTFLGGFRDEFGVPISPTVAMLREGAPESVRTVAAFGGLRDAVCVSAIVAGRALTLKWAGPSRIVYSDAFDVDPWFPDPRDDGHIVTVTPALAGMNSAAKLQPQSAPALAERSLSLSNLDDVLLRALLAHWEDYFATGNDTAENRRLFRALEMARAASRMPGGTDATFFDDGRAVALWVSAFEILAHDGKWSGLKEVLTRLDQVQWLRAKLKVQDRQVNIGKKETFQTNVASEVYGHLYRVRNDFLHGNPVTPETLKLETCRRSVLFFAAPLFRLALTAFLNLRFSETLLDTANNEDRGRHIAKQIAFNQPQRLAEDAILMADTLAASSQT
jgi:hypothetical protein